MGGRGTESATAKNWAANNRKAFGEAAARQEEANATESYVSPGMRQRAEILRTAERLVNSKKAKEIDKENEALSEITMALRGAYGNGYGKFTWGTLSELEELLRPGLLERPLGLSEEKWALAKRRTQRVWPALEAKGATPLEVATFLMFETNIIRQK